MVCFHIPVMLKEVIYHLIHNRGGGVYIDCTLGGGGHSKSILERVYPQGILVGIDQDIEAINRAKEELSIYQDKVIFINDNFKNLEAIISDLKIKNISGILYDLGVSSHQLRERKRGFSFQDDGPLDMRMDLSQQFKASTLINNYSEKELIRVFKTYGEERFALRIARTIVLERQKNPITSTKQLEEIVFKSLPAEIRRKRRWKINPSTRIFQAIRIEVNKELEALESSLIQAIRMLGIEGRICVISYHSLEDRIVKNIFKEAEKKDEQSLPYKMKILTKKPITASPEEVEKNPRARSAKLRVIEKIKL